MINHEKLAQIKSSGVPVDPVPKGEMYGFNLNNMTTEDLIRLHATIESKLPPAELGSMNLERELVMQYRRVLTLQEDVLTDESVPANQRAQVANAVAGALQHLVRMQSEFHTSERFKAMENLMIKYMKKLPLEVAEEFLDEYERLEEN